MRAAAARLACLALVLAACTEGPAPFAPSPTPTPSPPATAPGGSPAPGAAFARIAAVGDVGDGSDREAAVADAILRAHRQEPLDALVLLGDLIYPRGNPREYEEKFARPYRGLLEAGVPMHPALGNHDIQTDREAFMRVFDMSARFYAARVGPVELFVLDTSRGAVDEEQVRWLEGTLARSTAAWKVAAMHVPPYSSGMHGSNAVLQDQIVPVLERGGVQLVLAGHDHNYERTRPIRGAVYVISGGGCCPRDVGRTTITAHSASLLHFVIIEATAQQLTIEAIDRDGRVFDRATIRAEAAAA